MNNDIARFGAKNAMAIMSSDEKYRYVLGRTWDLETPKKHLNYVNFVMLNPSTATHAVIDPTIRRCVGFAKKWQFDGMYVTNLFAFRATSPRTLKFTADPIGPNNDHYLRRYATLADRVVVAWGGHGNLKGRNKGVGDLLLDTVGNALFCLGRTKDGNPRHPLYRKYDCAMPPWGVEDLI